MTNLDNFIKALKVTWLRRICTDKKSWQFTFHIFESQNPLLWLMGANYVRERLNVLTNPFWRDTLGAWVDFVSRCKPKSPQHILSEPLWCNDNFQDNRLFFQLWANKRILFVSDIVKEDGHLLSFNEFKVKFNIRGTFLDYNQLIMNIPGEYRLKLAEQTMISHSVPIPLYLQELISSKTGCRKIYDILNNQTCEIASQQ